MLQRSFGIRHVLHEKPSRAVRLGCKAITLARSKRSRRHTPQKRFASVYSGYPYEMA